MFAIPFVAAISDALGLTLEKIALGKNKMAVSLYLPLLFLFIFVVSAVLTPFLGAFDYNLVFQTKYVVYFILMILLAVTWNYLSAQSIQKERLHEHEMILMLQPGAIILLASVFSPVHTDTKVLIASLVAALFLIISRIKRGHFDFSQYSLNMVIAVFLMAVESLVINELLKAYSPVSLYALRTGFVFLFYLIYFRPKFYEESKENYRLVFGSALLGTICMIARFYGYKDLGIVPTTVVLIISPVLLYLISARYFKEKLNLRTILSFVVILGCIAYVTFIDAVSH